MLRAISRAPSHAPLPFLLHRHPVRAALLRWGFLRRWLAPDGANSRLPDRRKRAPHHRPA